MSKIQWIRPCLIMLLFGSLNGATWAEAKDEATENMTALTENSAGVAASGAALDPMAVDVNTLLARQPTGKMIDPTEQWLLAISRRPIAVGAARLALEADGLRRLPPHVVKAWQESREILTY